MPRALSHFRLRRARAALRGFGLAALALTLSRAALAEPVTHTFTGTVTEVTDGTLGLLDLTGSFSNGQAVTIVATIERSTAIFTQDQYSAVYASALQSLTLTIGTYVATGPGLDFEYVTNDIPPGFKAGRTTLGAPADEYAIHESSPSGPAIGDAAVASITVDLFDANGTAFGSLALPRVMPAISEFESASFNLQFYDAVQGKTGVVAGTLSDVSTPAHATSWGLVKGLYRGQ